MILYSWYVYIIYIYICIYVFIIFVCISAVVLQDYIVIPVGTLSIFEHPQAFDVLKNFEESFRVFQKLFGFQLPPPSGPKVSSSENAPCSFPRVNALRRIVIMYGIRLPMPSAPPGRRGAGVGLLTWSPRCSQEKNGLTWLDGCPQSPTGNLPSTFAVRNTFVWLTCFFGIRILSENKNGFNLISRCSRVNQQAGTTTRYPFLTACEGKQGRAKALALDEHQRRQPLIFERVLSN